MWIKQTDQGIIWPYTRSQLKKDYPNVSFPKVLEKEILESYNVFKVEVDNSQPDYDRSKEELVLTEPFYSQGSWIRKFKVEPLED